MEWFYRNMSQYQAMFWVDAAEPSQLASNYAKIAQILDIHPKNQAEDLVADREIAKSWLADATVPWLLIFDNADNIDLLADYWPYGGAGSILITSRDPLSKAFRSLTMPGLDLEPFSEPDASELVRKVTNCDSSEAEHQASIDMARELGCLPLAIIHMAGVIRRRQWSLQEFLENYHTRYRSLRKIDHNSQFMRYGSHFATAWNFEDLDADAIRLLRLLSMLSPDRIQERLLVQPDISSQSIPFFDQEDIFENAKDALLSSSVIKRNKVSRELSIHRIIAQEGRACMSPEDLCNNFDVAVNILCAAWPFNDRLEKRHATGRWAQCEEVFPHVEHVHKLYGAHRADWMRRTPTMNLVRLFQEGGA